MHKKQITRFSTPL